MADEFITLKNTTVFEMVATDGTIIPPGQSYSFRRQRADPYPVTVLKPHTSEELREALQAHNSHQFLAIPEPRCVLEVIAPGERVTVGGKIDARVLQVCLKPGEVFYQVGYWQGNEWKEVWLPASEVVPGAAAKVNVGFKGTNL